MTGAQAAINATIASLAYQGNLDFVGSDTLTVTSTDSASSTDSDTVAIAVTPVNDAPAGTDATVTTNEDTVYAFTVANFGFTDVDGGDALSAVRIDTLTLPVGATLQLSGVNVNANDVILVADITAGNLVFTPALNQNGAGYASFTFTVRDTGGPAFDPAPNTMTVNVTAVDDLPLALDDVYLTNEDTPLVVPAAAGLFRNDSGLDDGGIALSVLGLPIGGTVVVNNDGSFTFTPTANFNGPARLQLPDRGRGRRPRQRHRRHHRQPGERRPDPRQQRVHDHRWRRARNRSAQP